MDKKYGALSSSVNPQELSLTITAGVRTVLAFAAMLGYINAADIDTALEQVPVLVMSGYAIWQGLEVLWGVVRKAIVAATAQ